MRKTSKVLILITAIAFLVSACASVQPVATLEELADKQELYKRRNWFKQSHARATTAAAMGGSLILLPIGLIIYSIPNERKLTIEEIADTAVAKEYDYESIIYSNWIGYTDGALSPDFLVVATSKKHTKDEEGLKPIGVVYRNSRDKKVYFEGRIVKKLMMPTGIGEYH